jgi:membrane-associated phospholipid phosphatase
MTLLRIIKVEGIQSVVSIQVRKVLRLIDRVFLCCGVLFAAVLCARSETKPENPLPDAPQAQSENQGDVSIRALPGNLLKDQAAIWTSPFRLRGGDLKIVAPLLLATGAAIATDHRALRDLISLDPAFNNDNTNASNVLIGGFIAAPVILYGVGHYGGNEHARETGMLGAEALVDGVVVEQGMKLIFWRERPYQDQERGRFFQSSAGVDSSFPSSHSVLAWSTAAVIAGEYRNPWTQVLVYTGAAGISFTRLMGQQHFPSDVIVGSAAGWLIGHYVYKHRHRWEVKHPVTR